MALPNIILITSDQQRFDAVGINGSGFLHTPTLDRLAGEGVNCARAYCPNPVCTPSRVSLMTGMHLSRHGSYNIGVQPKEVDQFLSGQLRRAGYQTFQVGKAHWHPWGTKGSPEYQHQPSENFREPWKDFAGFDLAELSIGHGPTGIFGHYRHWLEQRGVNLAELKVDPALTEDPNETGDWTLPSALHSGAWTVERSLSFLERCDASRPFFLNVGFQDPHHPHVLPYDFPNRLDPAAVPPSALPAGAEKGEAPHVPLFRNDGLQDSRFRGPFEIAGQGPTPWETYSRDGLKSQTTRAYYYGMVQLLDEQLGQLVAGLESMGLTEDTVIIFTSDHGEMLGDHGIFQKGPLAYESVTHVPLIFWGPQWVHSGTAQECLSLVDIFPTVLDLCGQPLPYRCDGVSLKKMLRDGTPIERPGVRIECKEEPDRIRYRAFVTAEWKLAIYLGEDFGELYDLRRDPGEYENLFDDPAHFAQRHTLMRQLLEDMERSEPANPRGSRV